MIIRRALPGDAAAMTSLQNHIIREGGTTAYEEAREEAKIRADNRPGLAYYARLGFADYSADPGWALKSGVVVGRVSRRLEL